ncbi:putative pyridoxal kinase [Pestalotiopsis sp. IQ-011]
MSAEPPVPETSVLAVASHVVSGHVGNKIAVFVLQSMGCDVSALNTVQFSNHTGYRQWRGTRVSAQEITDLWEGLKQSYLDRFDMMLSGYVPGAAAVEAVGDIAKELRDKSRSRPGSFFWVLDPVMGDNGKLYVADDVVPAYRGLVQHADLILPNQFEAEQLSEVKITDSASLRQAIEVLHTKFNIPHIVITSVSLPLSSDSESSSSRTMSVVGSTKTSAGKPRLFKIHFPVFECYFSGTGDMFAALMVVRMREVAHHIPGLSETASWLSADDVAPLDLPLARAAEKVLASMHEVLSRTCESMEVVTTTQTDGEVGASSLSPEEEERKTHLLRSRAAELRLVRNLGCLRSPKVEYKAEKM